MPKGVMLTHLSVINALFGFYTFGELRGIIHQEELLDMENASILLNVPLFHVTGLITQFLLSMLAKRNIILMRKWDATEALELIAQHKVTNLSGVPAQSWDLLNHPDVDNYDLSSLTDIAAGGAARPEEQVISLNKKFNIPQSFAWGMTETTAIGTLLRGNDYLHRPNSAGLCVPDLTDIRIVDDNWNFLDTGQIGEMVFKSPTNTIGYLKNPEETEKTFKDGYFSMQKGLPSQSKEIYRGFLISAGFMFAESRLIEDVPYDPHLYFEGEETTLSLRLFTNGYDVFHIPKIPLFHCYVDYSNLAKRPMHWNEDEDKNRTVKWNELVLKMIMWFTYRMAWSFPRRGGSASRAARGPSGAGLTRKKLTRNYA